MQDPDAQSARRPPGPDGAPLIGNTVGFLRDGLPFADRLREYGDVVAFDALGREFVIVTDPDLVRTVLVDRSDEFCKGEFESSFGALLAPEGLAFTDGDRWRADRTALQPAFRPGRIRSFVDDVVERSAAASAQWADRGTLDVAEATSELTLEILARTLFDLDLDEDRGQRVRAAVDAMAARTSGLSMIVPDWLPTPTRRRFRRRMAALDDTVAAMVAERTGEDPPDDLLTTILEADREEGPPRSDDWIRDQLVTFLFAGHETTATALTYALWSLAGAPAVRDRLDRELSELDDDPGLADLGRLEYAGGVVDEALRLYPPVYALYREPEHDVELGGYEIPGSATLILDAYGLHRDERYWDAPAEFRPERMLEDDPDRPEYAYFPFGGGPRHCIGMRFARMELRLALATLARRCSFERVTSSLDLRPRATLDPGVVELRVTRRPGVEDRSRSVGPGQTGPTL